MIGKKIVFVGMSTDTDKKKWETFVEKNGLGGIQLFQGMKGGEFKRFYMIDYIPRFILLDKKGRIVDAFMTRPSDEKTKEKLIKLKGI